MRILHLPVAAGRQAWGLSRAEKRAGHISRVIIFEQNSFQLDCDQILFEPNDNLAVQELKRWKLFLSSIFKYDVFHFHFGQKFFTLFPRPYKKGDRPVQAILRFIYWFYSLAVGRLDIFILRILKKRILMTFHGDDLRQGDRSLQLYEFSIAQAVGDDYYDSYSDRRKRRMADYYLKKCDALYVVSPDLLDMAPKGAKLIHYTGVNADDWKPTERASNPRPVVVHAPTHRLAKGTRFIEAAVARLKAQGYDFEFILVENMANEDARALYSRADLVIDQLLAGWFGVFALEMMAMGKPVICYIRNENLSSEPTEFQTELPIINASPSNIESVLEESLKQLSSLKARAHATRSFVRKWYDPDQIAARILMDSQKKA